MALIDALAEIRSVAGRRSAIAADVLAVLEAQNRAWGPSAAREAQLAQLARGAVAVVTGQQLGLCLGPLYTIWKAASAVRLARDLAASGIPAVPVFWLQAEDHDWDEIRTLRWPAGDGTVREVGLPPRPPERARSSIAHEVVPAEMAQVIDVLGRELGGDARGAAFVERVAAHHRPGATVVSAFGGLLAELFEPHGLLTIQPREVRLAAHAAAVHRRAIEDHDAIAAGLARRTAEIEASGGRVPVPVRTDCALSFFHPDGPEGARYRLVPRGDTLALAGDPRTFDRREILDRLERAPLELSTSALLRPLLQDLLLPTAAYVGGPSEVAYARQLAPIYERFGLEMAPFVRRASFLVVRPEDRRDLDALHAAGAPLAPAELAEDEAALVQRLGRGPIGDRIDALAAHARHELAELRGPLAELDPNLLKSAAKTEANLEQTLAKLAASAARASAGRHPERLLALRRARAALRPGGEPQERVHGLPAIATLDVAAAIAAAIERAPESQGGAEVEIAP